MNYIQFPSLGINLTVNPVAFTIGNLDVQWYGIIIALGFLLATTYAILSAKYMRLNSDALFDTIIVGLICGIIGARLYYVAFYPGDFYIENPKEIFNIKGGGLGIYGGLIFGSVSGIIMAKIRKINFLAVLDVASIGYLIGQGIGRWGNFINQEAFGVETSLPWGMYSNMTALESANPVHPCFLYESLLCLLGVVVLHIFTRKYRKYDGQTFLLYVIWYGIARFFIEGLRTDSLMIVSLNLRVSQVVAVVSVIVAIALLIVFRNRTALSGCGNAKIMELNGVDLSLPMEDQKKKEEESTFVSILGETEEELIEDESEEKSEEATEATEATEPAEIAEELVEEEKSTESTEESTEEITEETKVEEKKDAKD